jgi:deoxyribonuclease IV
MSAQLLGAHMPTAGGLAQAVLSGRDIGCTAVQVFTSSPQQWKAKEITDEMVGEFQAAKRATHIDVVVSHDSYLINLCAPDPDKRAQSIEGIKREIVRCHRYGIPYAVSHVGAHMGQGLEEGLSIAAESLRQVLDQSSDDVMVLMETTAGQGSSLNFQFEQIATLLAKLAQHPRLGVCLDTCHIFAAGYDIRSVETYEATFEHFGRTVGFKNLKAVHCNDSKKPLGSHVDRHAHIGEGEIGLEAFRLLMNDARFTHVPILLETPDAPEHHARNLATLRSLARA